MKSLWTANAYANQIISESTVYASLYAKQVPFYIRADVQCVHKTKFTTLKSMDVYAKMVTTWTFTINA